MNETHRFIEHLDQLQGKKNLQAFAVFRRSLGRPPGQDIAPFLYLGRFVGSGTSQDRVDLICLIAGLYSLPNVKPQPEARSSFGKTLADYCRAHSGATSGVERRLVALLNCHRDDIPDHLRHIVTLIKRSEQSIDWERLLDDLSAWDREDRRVQRTWARDFWGSLETAPADEASEAQIETTLEEKA